MIYQAPTLAEFKKLHQDENGNWLNPSDAISYKVLERYHAGAIKHKTPEQIEKEAKKQEKEDELKRVIEEKKQWYK